MGLRFRVQGSGFRDENLRFGVYDVRCKIFRKEGSASYVRVGFKNIGLRFNDRYEVYNREIGGLVFLVFWLAV